MDSEKLMVALDCGNSSFRTLVGKYSNGVISTTIINQSENGMVKVGDYFYWDMLYIYNTFKKSLKEIVKNYGHIDSIGVCTWGVDFALFDSKGHMLSNPLCYRNTFGEEMLSQLSDDEKKEMFYDTGILCDKINSVYMLSGMKKTFSKIYDNADKMLMVPDILNFFLTDKMINEPSEFSTTQLMNTKDKVVSDKICDKFAIKNSLFCEIGEHGKLIGNLRKDILEEIGHDVDIPIICVPSHDTGSAIAAIPAKENNFGFISCGTWSLIGTELDEPIINDEVKKANLTNEVGAFSKITLLKNSSGMFIVNELKKEYDFISGKKVPWDDITNMAEKCEVDAVFDINDNVFFNPQSMSKEIWAYLLKTKQVNGELRFDVLFKAFYESLACCYAVTISDTEKVVNKKFEKIYIVGGGSASRVLINFSAIHIGKPIVICYGESTSMGNLGVQLSYFYPDFGLKGIREVISKSYKTEEISLKKGREELLDRYIKLVNG